MGNNKNTPTKSRRDFFSLFTSKKPVMVKMLTADGKLVEVDKAVLDAFAKKKKASNDEILSWMQNPSKSSNS